MRTETSTRTLYKFEELSDTAKEKARDWYREGNTTDEFWSESVKEDAACMADILGIDLNQTRKTLMGGGHRYAPTIYWSGFCSQGDGACFEGKYAYKKGAVKAIKSESPTDVKLHQIAQDLQDAQRKAFYKLEASTKHSGHYYHSGCMAVEIYHVDDQYRDVGDAEETIKQALRDFADWIYRQLETEYEYQNSDETVDENITLNEYEFTEQGEIA